MSIRTRFPFLYSVFNKLRRDCYLLYYRLKGDKTDPRAIFNLYFSHNLFGDTESRSGTGSSLMATTNLRAALPLLIREMGISSVLDMPCGDFYWAKEINWSGLKYIGADIVPELIEENRKRYGQRGLEFIVLDGISESLPKVDLIICRDLLIHLPNAIAKEVITNIKQSGAKWLLTTHYKSIKRNRDIRLGSFRPVNLTLSPFELPQPLKTLQDDNYLKLWGRTLALWKIEELP
jgi:2-polyprenyl-3-methyl-5-hydroxy-6-metoxy-1,4-benzoquinol methylase